MSQNLSLSDDDETEFVSVKDETPIIKTQKGNANRLKNLELARAKNTANRRAKKEVLEVHKSINKARTLSEKATTALQEGRKRAVTAGVPMPEVDDTHSSLMSVIEDMRNEIRSLKAPAPEPAPEPKPKRVYKKKEPVKIEEKLVTIDLPVIPTNVVSEAPPVNKRRAEYEEKIKQQDTRLDLLKALMRRK